MNKEKITIDIDLSSYFGEHHEQVCINSLQEYEEWLFNNFESYHQYIDINEVATYYDDYNNVYTYLKKEIKATKEEIELFKDTINSDIHRSMAYAKDQSYQDEWIQKYITLLVETIEEDAKNILNTFPSAELIEPFSSNDTKKWDITSIQIIVDKQELSDYFLKEEKENYNYSQGDEKDNDILQEYLQEIFEYDQSGAINIDHIDYYGTLGDYDDYMQYFIDYNDCIQEIKDYREEEKAKINSTKKMLEENSHYIEKISKYNDEYIKDESINQKIKRQIIALKKVIENAA